MLFRGKFGFYAGFMQFLREDMIVFTAIIAYFAFYKLIRSRINKFIQ